MTKTTVLLTLTFIMMSAASVNAQVTIGSLDDPHPSALLDLKSTTQGVILPQVALSGSTTFLSNGGDKNAAKGMLVYHTGSNMKGPGLYVWTGNMWEALATTCELPDQPGTIIFSPALSSTSPTNIVKKTLITATAPLTTRATSYTWSIPDEFEIEGDATGRSIKFRAISAGNAVSAAGITVKAVNDCGSSEEARAGAGTINVNECTGAPATPTISMPLTTKRLAPGDTCSIWCSDVAADTYHWTLPEGLTAESLETSVNSIVLTASALGIYSPVSIKVKASRICNETAYNSGENIGTGGLIFVEECQAPGDPSVPVLGGTFYTGGTFGVNIVINAKGAINYEWSLPAGLEIISEKNTYSVTIKANAAGIYKGSDIKLKATTSCGSITVACLGTFTVLSSAGGVQGPDFTGENGEYATYRYPANLGTWMTDNSKEGTPTGTSYPNHDEGERGYYYNTSDALGACPEEEGWTLPATAQYSALWSYLGAISSLTPENEPWVNPDKAGGYLLNETGSSWNASFVFWAASDNVYYRVNTPDIAYSNAIQNNPTAAFNVRCIKAEEECSEPPTIVQSIRRMSPVIPVGGQDTVIVKAASLGNTTCSWSVPSGVTIVSGQTSDTLVIRFPAKGNFSWKQLSCKVTNSCGSVTVSGDGDFIVTDTGYMEETDFTSESSNSYRTYNFPNGIGTWMIDNWKEEPATLKAYPGEHAEGERGYYYDYAAALTACPAGWKLPTVTQAYRMAMFAKTLPAEHPVRDAVWDPNTYAGYTSLQTNGTWATGAWGLNSVLWAETGWVRMDVGTFFGEWEQIFSFAATLRCVLEE
jgi:uncharacterized protein (TIGR02145 family)